MTAAAGAAPVRPAASIVVVAAGAPAALVGATLDTVAATTPDPYEVLVAVGEDDAPLLAGAAGPRPRAVTVPAGLPFGAAAGLAAATAAGDAVCVMVAGARTTAGWLPPLLSAVTGPGDVRLARPESVGDSGACFCVRRSALVAAGGIDPDAGSPAAAVTELTARLGALGFTATVEPAPAVAPPGAEQGKRPAPGPATRGRGHDRAYAGSSGHERILVVTPALPEAPYDPVVDLLDLVLAVRPDARLTVLAVDGHRAAVRAPRLLARGIEVVAGPRDWDSWFAARALAYTHVVAAALDGLGRVDGLVRRTQLQAHHVLVAPSLDFADAALLEPALHPLERAGARTYVRRLRARLARAVEGFDAVWCTSPRDQAWYGAALPNGDCHLLPLPVVAGSRPGLAGRRGVVVLASPGADIVAGHEDAAAAAVRDVLPLLLSRDRTVVARLVVDQPSPGVQLLAGEHVELVAAGDDPASWFRSARVCIAPYATGAGGRRALQLAEAAGVPVVLSGVAAASAGLGDHHPLTVADDAATLATNAWRLLSDDEAWAAARLDLDRRVRARSPEAARAAVARALAGAGILPEPRSGRTVPAAAVPAGGGDALPSPARPRLQRVPAVGQGMGDAPKTLDPADDVDPDAAYRRWVDRYGPTPARLAEIRTRLGHTPGLPKISVVMPVHDTEPAWLDEALRSVRDQLHAGWELCVADDGSTRDDTLAVLEAHRAAEPRIRVTRLPVAGGIVAATNAALALATGDYVGFLDHDDELKPHALAEVALRLAADPACDVLYTDEDRLNTDGRVGDVFLKSDWSPDHLMSRNYVCHFLVVRRTLLDKLGGLRPGLDGSQDYDLVLRAAELTDRIVHVAEPLYTWRKAPGSAATTADAKPWALAAARRALADALERRGTPGEVTDGMHPTSYRVRYALRDRPRVTIVIPTRDRVAMLRNCIESVLERTTYENFEIVVLDNESTDPDTLAYLGRLPGRVLTYPHRFNYARMMNLAAKEVDGDFLLLLNNDTEVRSPGWLEAMLEHGQRPEVGAVGARLLYPDGRAQHEGIIVGFNTGIAGNVDYDGYWGLGKVVRNCSAVTGACLLVRPSVYWAVGGHDERLRIAFNDVDFCLRVRQAGYDIVYTPYAELHHVEGGTRGIHPHPDDDATFEARWASSTWVDPYYNPNFDPRIAFRPRR